MNLLERIVRIHQLLTGSRRPVPMRRLMEELGASRNTVTRDLAYLRDFLGAPIVYDREANGHHYDPDAEAFELPGFWLNQSELYALLAIEHLLESVQPGFLGPFIGPLKARVRKLLGRAVGQPRPSDSESGSWRQGIVGSTPTASAASPKRCSAAAG